MVEALFEKMPGFVSVTELIKGDGRRTVQGPWVLGSRFKRKVSIAVVRHTIERFMKSGSSNHSNGRTLLPFIIAYCEENCISYTVTALFNDEGSHCGYYISRVENLK